MADMAPGLKDLMIAANRRLSGAAPPLTPGQVSALRDNLGRRAILRAPMAAAVPATRRRDGLRAPMNAPPAASLTPGVAAGAQSAIVRANIVIVSGPSGSPIGVYVYTPGTTPALGNPPIAAMTNSGTDPYGNSIRPGDAAAGGPLILLGPAPTGGTKSFIEFVTAVSQLQMLLGTGDTAEASPGALLTAIAGSGGPRFLATKSASPSFTGRNAATLELASQTFDGTSGGAQSILGSVATNLVVGDSANAATPLGYISDPAGIWSLTRSRINVSTNGPGNVATPADLTTAWAIPAGYLTTNDILDIETWLVAATGATTAQTLTLGVDINAGTRTALATLGAAFNGSALSTVYAAPLRLRMVVGGGTTPVIVHIDGGLGDTSASRLSTNSANMPGYSTGVTFNPAVANTIAIYAQWGGAGGVGQLAQTTYSVLRRTGQL